MRGQGGQAKTSTREKIYQFSRTDRLGDEKGLCCVVSGAAEGRWSQVLRVPYLQNPELPHRSQTLA